MYFSNSGTSGLKVSKICLGCMSFGDPTKGAHSWVISEEEGRSTIKKALELGINFNNYGDHRSQLFRGKVGRHRRSKQ